MLTKLTIRNFKPFADAEIALHSPVLFVGPNNSGKTAAMQALALWDCGLKRWMERREGKPAPRRRRGVPVNRRDLTAVPVARTNLLWHGLKLRSADHVLGRQKYQNIRIDIIVEGETGGKKWTCGLEFDYANEEVLYCRPLRTQDNGSNGYLEIPEEAHAVQIAFLPPMSGLAANETKLEQGAVSVRIGEGRTAEVLRNLCFQVYERDQDGWRKIAIAMDNLFGIKLESPEYLPQRSEITMAYIERGVKLDLASAGRGLHQTLLLLAYMYASPGSTILLDEPDAHLEILRQRQIYHVLTETAELQDSQIVAASHSEVLLNEAADRNTVVAFVGTPHRIERQHVNQVAKSLAKIGFEDYYQAVQTGWVLYLEGSTDLMILKEFARLLGNIEAGEALTRPFVSYVNNEPRKVEEHFYGLVEAYNQLRGVALFDRLDRSLPNSSSIKWLMWQRREIENYLCSESTLLEYARAPYPNAEPAPLFEGDQADRRVKHMRSAIREVESALSTLNKPSAWSDDIKASDDVLKPVMVKFAALEGSSQPMRKGSFYRLAKFVPLDEIADEVHSVLDAIAAIDKAARGE